MPKVPQEKLVVTGGATQGTPGGTPTWVAYVGAINLLLVIVVASVVFYATSRIEDSIIDKNTSDTLLNVATINSLMMIYSQSSGLSLSQETLRNAWSHLGSILSRLLAGDDEGKYAIIGYEGPLVVVVFPSRYKYYAQTNAIVNDSQGPARVPDCIGRGIQDLCASQGALCILTDVAC